MEIEILPTTKFADKKISELTIPKGVVIGGIVRNDELIFPDENTILLVKDKVIIFSEPSSIKDIEKYSEVNIEFLMLTYYVNGSYLNKADALISVEDRGFNFSDGVYEVIAFNKRKLLNLNKHIIRLKKSLKGISIKKPFFNFKSLELIILHLIDLNHLNKGFIYLQITRGSAKKETIYFLKELNQMLLFLPFQTRT